MPNRSSDYTNHQITTVVFDVGRVLVDFSFLSFLSLLNQHGFEGDAAKLFSLIDLNSHERGELSSEDFILRIESLLTKQIDRVELTRTWTEIFTPLSGMQDLAKHLRRSYKVALLSNTSEMHWQYLIHHCRLGELADSYLTSFEAGVMKPDAKIYVHAEQKFSCRPEQIVFIDDLEDNVRAAELCGWQAIVHISLEETKSKLVSLGIEV